MKKYLTIILPLCFYFTCSSVVADDYKYTSCFIKLDDVGEKSISLTRVFLVNDSKQLDYIKSIPRNVYGDLNYDREGSEAEKVMEKKLYPKKNPELIYTYCHPVDTLNKAKAYLRQTVRTFKQMGYDVKNVDYIPYDTSLYGPFIEEVFKF